MNPNSIKKNDWILVTRKDGAVLLGHATKVAPWATNPKITIVSYHFTDENGIVWGTKADATKCVLAPVDRIPKGPEPAATDPIMAKWSLGKERKGPQMMEGYYFSSVLFLNGVNVGKVADEGNGGCMVIMPNAKGYELKVAHQFMEDSKAWCIANGKTDHGDFEDFYSWWHDGRPNGKNAKTYLAEKEAEMQKWLGSVKPVTNSEAFVKAVNEIPCT